MRAFMSDRSDARRTCAAAISGVPLADLALTEARAILAETEPESGLAYHDDASPAKRAIGAWRGEPYNQTAHEALADALRAFVEE